MSSLSVEVQGKRYVAKTTPMMPLSAVVEEVCRQAKLSCDPAGCTLRLQGGGKPGAPLDLATPVRFANLPTGAKLQLSVPAGVGRQLGVAAPTPAPAAPAAPAAPPAAPRPPPPAAAAPPRPASEDASIAETEGEGEGAARGAAGGNEEALAPVERRVGRHFALFPWQALAASGAEGSSQDDPPDAFYELTPEDLFKMEAAKKAKAAEEKTLMTRAMRESRDRQRAATMGPVGVRVVLPGDRVLQTSFRASDSLAALQEFVAACLAPGSSWYLYTTPPKAELKQYDQSFYSAGFAPAVKLYLGTKAAGGEPPVLREDVLAHERSTPPRREDPTALGGAGRPAPTPQPRQAAAPAGGTDKAGNKVPKWLKL
eukprot:jgi/Tetstr1/464611/TSEL_009365.t1